MIVKKIFRKAIQLFLLPVDKINLLFLNRKFGSVGIGTKIHRNVWISEPEYIFLGEKVRIAPLCRIETYSNYCGVKTVPKLMIKNAVSIQHAVHIYCNNSVEIQEGVLIASGCMITDNNHGTDPLGDYYEIQPLNFKSTVIKEGAWLGENVAILAGSIVGKRSIIGANSVVRGVIPDYCVAVGNPAKVVKRYNFETKSWEKV